MIAIDRPTGGDSDDRELLVPLVRRRRDRRRGARSTRARERHAAARAELPMEAMKLSRGEPVIPTRYLEAAGMT